MSAYKTIKTSMTNAAVLKAALEQAKPEWLGKVEVPEAGKTITISGDSKVKGELKVSRANAGTYSDLGVVRTKEGNLSWKISDVDTGDYYGDAESREKKGKLFGKTWQQAMSAEYALVESCAHAKQAGAQIGTRQTYNHPQWGKVPGFRCRIKKSTAVV
jgi:hypothetical protein